MTPMKRRGYYNPEKFLGGGTTPPVRLTAP